jgi:DNA-binding NarL/FixJ family response regulator
MHALAIGMDEIEATFLKAIRAGATGYLLREASALEVMGAIRAVSQGEAICPPRLCRALFKIAAQAEQFIPTIRVRMNLGLTRRQQELVPLIARGLTNKEIASRLNLSEQTIKNHIHRMLRKVGADGRAEVVEIAGGARCGCVSTASLGLGQSGGRGHSGRAGSGWNLSWYQQFRTPYGRGPRRLLRHFVTRRLY